MKISLATVTCLVSLFGFGQSQSLCAAPPAGCSVSPKGSPNPKAQCGHGVDYFKHPSPATSNCNILPGSGYYCKEVCFALGAQECKSFTQSQSIADGQYSCTFYKKLLNKMGPRVYPRSEGGPDAYGYSVTCFTSSGCGSPD